MRTARTLQTVAVSLLVLLLTGPAAFDFLNGTFWSRPYLTDPSQPSAFKETEPTEGDVAYVVEWTLPDLSRGERKCWTKVLATAVAREMRVSTITQIVYVNGEWRKAGDAERVID